MERRLVANEMLLNKFNIDERINTHQIADPVASEVAHIASVRDDQMCAMTTAVFDIMVSNQAMARVLLLFNGMRNSLMFMKESMNALRLQRPGYIAHQEEH